jgi:diacylglycerol kinase (ATP)
VRWTVVVNPVAGRGRARRYLPSLRAAASGMADVDVVVTGGPEDTAIVAREAFARGDGVAAAGGDGTVAAVAGVAAEADGLLAVIPFGAGNDFARHLGIDHRRPVDAMQLLEGPKGREVRCDLGRVTASDGTSAWFTTVAHTGFDTEANRWANGVGWARGTTLYVLAVFRTLATYHPQHVRVEVDDRIWEGDAWLAAAGNACCYAGGMRITPDASIEDGMLDVCCIGALPVWKIVEKFPSVFRGTHTRVRGVEMLRGRLVTFDAPGARRLEVWASGERVGPLPATIEAVPGAVRVRAPATTT